MTKFLREVFSDNGVGSFSNAATFILIFPAIFWITYLVIKKETMPDFTGLCLFIGTLYGIKKVAATVSSFTGK